MTGLRLVRGEGRGRCKGGRRRKGKRLVTTWLPGRGVVCGGQTDGRVFWTLSRSSENCVCNCLASEVWPYCISIARREDTSSGGWVCERACVCVCVHSYSSH